MALGKGKVLGRGLGNLIPVNEKNVELNSDDISGLREIRISEIVPNPHQPRKHFSETAIQELSQTIQQHGVIQPIVVQKNQTGSGFILIAGERRLRACKLAGFQKIPAIVKDVSDADMMELALIENLQREDLNPIEEAQAYQNLIEKRSLKVTDLATRVGKNRSTIANLIRLLGLPSQVQDLIKEGKLSEGQTRPLLSLPETKKQIEVANKIITENWTAREVENYVSSILNPDKKQKSSGSESEKDASIVKIEGKLRNKFSAKVEISHNDNTGKGKITFSYANLSDMERILEQLGLKL
ncbi:ParB/RepB/Spo0J family partition protein [Leptospira ilyithenensis]|uniref:ParB/RepB/Spo0J family partition protein n=1 Tax=Leptospira ilyithenensis TaxID=2484901 RepID=A0A4R9LS27_9LEPT|nr:ParB/RepB/Spo0J family partition protein [Leptospira ilyithenensis]TGN10968.1 ParB/RepB/Spo0J family partition protein [Leptospira ilyithenensis]